MKETFRRFEKKYLLTEQQYQMLLEKLKDYVEPDMFYESKIRSIYYDNERFEMIRRSIEKPEYKEKLRIRSYDEAADDDMVFVEFKKKLDGIVYKRRTKARCADVIDDIYTADFVDEQIGNEIKYALNYYGKVKPAVYIGCTRTSYVGKQDKRLRITFDRDIAYRMKDLSLRSDKNDKAVTEMTVMELKIPEAMPLWLTQILDELKVYPHSFSKVGTAFLSEVRRINL
ncbi:MAG: polyphosphate polymerase domain-containing protein [Erysipelotrichaceae bacterium]|nr:polyphosphate polymerase domain-containing protein [Erysipelotrichaceae bacterium]